MDPLALYGIIFTCFSDILYTDVHESRPRACMKIRLQPFLPLSHFTRHLLGKLATPDKNILGRVHHSSAAIDCSYLYEHV